MEGAQSRTSIRRESGRQHSLGRNKTLGEDHMKRMYVLGLFLGALMLLSYEPAAQAMPAFGPSFANFDGVVVKVYYGHARRVTRRTARRVYRRHHYY